jgi:hypothetical protein
VALYIDRDFLPTAVLVQTVTIVAWTLMGRAGVGGFGTEGDDDGN